MDVDMSVGLLRLTAVRHAAFTGRVFTVWGFSWSLVREVLTLTRALYLDPGQAQDESEGCVMKVTRRA